MNSPHMIDHATAANDGSPLDGSSEIVLVLPDGSERRVPAGTRA